MNIPAHQVQGSDAWHEYRRTRGNASEVAALLGVSPWFPRTPHQLWQVKTGRKDVYENEAMRRGSRLEAPARAHVEDRIGDSFSPDVHERGRLSASLDGITLEGSKILELKVPAKGRESATWQHTEQYQTPPKNYWWQIQQQLLCAGVDRCVFAVCEADANENIIDCILCEVEADEKAQQEIVHAWDWFFPYLDRDEEPPADMVERNDAEWQDAAERFRQAKQQEAAVKAEVEAARNALVELADEERARGAGVKVQRLWINGSIDYKAAIPEGTDLEPYRKAGRHQTRVDLETSA
ncbi:MAG TPA: YqaJ viral recombinase family protein [Gammaproteobacteria bacterium]|nr:YqaJ viral recombinase family protein [Gammaproteobacteria bacterium]